MTDKAPILEELKELNSNLPSPGVENTLTVPAGYFDGLSSIILARVKNTAAIHEELKDISPLVVGISKQMPYSVPENYFETNMEILPYMLHEAESPLLTTIGKDLPYHIPAGYFESVSPAVQNRLKPQARVVSMFSRKWMKVAIAAVFTGLIAFSGYNYFIDSPTEEIALQDTINNQDSIRQQEQLAKNDVISEIKNMSTPELDAFIQNIDVSGAKNSAIAKKSSGTIQVKELIKDIPDKDLESFLDAIPTDDDELFLID